MVPRVNFAKMKAPATQSDVVIPISKRLKISKEESDVVTPRAIPVEITKKAASAIPASKLANEMYRILKPFGRSKEVKFSWFL